MNKSLGPRERQSLCGKKHTRIGPGRECVSVECVVESPKFHIGEKARFGIALSFESHRKEKRKNKVGLYGNEVVVRVEIWICLKGGLHC